MARYFLHLTPDGSSVVFWRQAGSFAGELYHYNLNLLAHAVGDNPGTGLPAGATLVPTKTYDFGGSTPVTIQPFAFSRPGGNASRPEALPIGSNLRSFLDDPLNGEPLDLSLPFYDEEMKLGPSGGGWFRKDNDSSAFHGGTDFVTRPRAVYDVCAAASGKVVGRARTNGGHGGPLVLSHHTSGGKEFRTIYQHLDINSVPSDLSVGASVRRGQYLGRVSDVSVIHLHFGVAVQGPGITLNGMSVPSLWYFIDPWGVYDYYEHDDTTNSTYLPPERRSKIFESSIAADVHTVHWRSEPLFKTIPIARLTNGYTSISRVQTRVRRRNDFGGTLPKEHEQFLVWLKDQPGFFLVPLSQATDRTTELELVALLREAFFHSKRVRLEYRYVGNQRYIMAAWVRS